MPTGTVAFLFSDIEGSTSRWERDRVAMAEALRRHDRILRESIESSDGYVFKTIGDAFCASFASTGDALRAAVAVHRGLACEDFRAVDGLRVRIAIHVGQAEERDRDYFGPTVNRVARLLSTAHGGQTILSATATALARATLPAEATVLDLGVHRLKDLAEPEAIAQLNVPDLPHEFPPLHSLDATRNNLPSQLLPLIGREWFVAELERMIGLNAIVTLVGEGGIGKTRTALHVAAESVDRYSGGVWYVGLATISNPAHVASQFLADLGLRETAGRAPLESVILWLAARDALLVVDNCEQIVAEAARAVRAIVERCPRVRVLCTSREALRLEGERPVRMPSLTFPSAGVELGVDEARGYESVVLFEARAQTADSHFELSVANATIVGAICRRLDGIALAIELAAARIKVLSPAQILAKLDERFRLLTGGRRNVEQRQATLHAAIAWSYDLLSPRDRTIFERDGIFSGAWPLEASLAVCADDENDEFEVIDAVEALVNKSLVSTEGDSDTKIYRLLESTRSFALLKLRENGALEAMRARHAAYALAVARDLDDRYVRLPTTTWERDAERAIAELRAAIAWTLDEGNDPPTGIAIVANLRWYWSSMAASEGLARVMLARERSESLDVPRNILGKLAIAEASIATATGDYAAQRDAAARAREYWAGASDLELAIAERTYAAALLFLDSPSDAPPILDRALRVFRAQDCGMFASLALDTLGFHYFRLGDLERARANFSEAIATAKACGFERGLLFYNINLAEVEASAGNVETAIVRCLDSLEKTYAKRESFTFALAWSNLAMYYTHLGRFDDGRDAARTALDFARESGAAAFEALALQSLAAVRAEGDDLAIAARIAGYADARLAERGFARGALEQAQYDRIIERVRAGVGAAATDDELAAGRALTAQAVTTLTAF
jgi:predicted ATPase/class 3 adenylate cyclase